MIRPGVQVSSLADLASMKLAVRAGTTTEKAVRTSFPNAAITTVGDHTDGIAALKAGTADAYFADKAIVLGILRGRSDAGDFALSKTTFTAEPYALALPRGDEDLRLMVDRALSTLYRTGAVLDVYRRHFGEPGDDVALFYRTVALPE